MLINKYYYNTSVTVLMLQLLVVICASLWMMLYLVPVSTSHPDQCFAYFHSFSNDLLLFCICCSYTVYFASVHTYLFLYEFIPHGGYLYACGQPILIVFSWTQHLVDTHIIYIYYFLNPALSGHTYHIYIISWTQHLVDTHTCIISYNGIYFS